MHKQIEGEIAEAQLAEHCTLIRKITGSRFQLKGSRFQLWCLVHVIISLEVPSQLKNSL